MTTALTHYRASGQIAEYVRLEEAQAALRRLEGDKLTKRRAHCFLRCLWELGPRPSELLRLRVKDIDWQARTVHLVTLKQKKPKDPKRAAKWQPPWRVIPVKDGLLTEMADYLTAAGIKEPETRAWTWTRRFAHSICHRALIAVGVESQRSNPRALRHGFAVNCGFHGVPIQVIQQWLGHADAKTTSIYMQIIARDARPWHDKVEF